MSDMSIENRLANIETCYTRFTDGLHRIGNAVEKQENTLDRAMKIIVGYLDPDTNQYVNGMMQTMNGVKGKQDACLARQSNRWKRAGVFALEVGAVVLSAWLIAHFGIRG